MDCQPFPTGLNWYFSSGLSTTARPHQNRFECLGILNLEDFSEFNLVGRSPAFVSALNLIRRFATCDVTVLIQGETGTGKELAARAIHYLSNRRDFPFIPVNCGALPDSLIENELFGHAR